MANTLIWHSGNSTGRINKLTVCQARLVLGWVTIFRRKNYLGM